MIYFEIPEAIGRIQTLRAEVHIYIFGKQPLNPFEGLNKLSEARTPLCCQTLGLEDEQGGVELRADWFIDCNTAPTFKPTPKPFRPASSPGMQQVRVKVRNQVFGRFEYLFHTVRMNWEPCSIEKLKSSDFPDKRIAN